MPSKTVKKITPPVETVVSEPVQIVEAVTEPVVTKNTEAVQTVVQPTTQKQKGGKKNAKTPPVEAAPVEAVTPVEAAPVEAAPVKPTKRGGAKSKALAPVQPVVSEETKPETKKRVPKVKAVVAPESSEQTGGKPKVAKKQATKPKVVKPVVETEAENDESTDRRIRSFKVKLPEKEDFEGRFTGLTPYQAANKALSKYFRETENPKKEITFIICESTRKSKKSLYTYIGRRYQLDVPVKYTIQDGREIVKNFKNSLKKVKKVDLVVGDAVVPVAV